MLNLLGFLRTDLSPWRYGNTCFLVALCHLIVRIPNLEVATKRLLHQQVKNTRVVLMPCSHMGVHPYWYFQRCGYFWGLWVSFATTDEFSVRVQKLLQELVSHQLTAYLSILNLFKLNELWPYYQKHINQIILNCTTL